jgi:hypothetical protein
MKKLSILFFILISALLLNGCGNKQESAGNDSKKDVTTKKEESKDVTLSDNSAYHITYKMSGKETEGMLLDLFKKGKKSKSEISSAGGEDKLKASAYYSDKVVYTITEVMGQRIGMKMDVSEMGGKDSKGFEKELFSSKDHLKDYEKTGKGDVLGYSCDIYKDKEGNQYYFYKDEALLKLVSKQGTMEATKFEPDAKLDDAMFEPPKDVEYMNMKDMDLSKFKMPK